MHASPNRYLLRCATGDGASGKGQATVVSLYAEVAMMRYRVGGGVTATNPLARPRLRIADRA